MGKINIPPQSRVSGAEDLYYRIQINPDRIRYTIPGTSHNILKGAILGTAGFNSKIQENLQDLEKHQWLDMNGPLYKAWLKYHGAAEASQNLSNDPTMMTALDEFQRLACVGSSYKKLPERAAKAEFWEKTSEVALPRITQQEHQTLG
jgi:hypothetical protein